MEKIYQLIQEFSSEWMRPSTNKSLRFLNDNSICDTRFGISKIITITENERDLLVFCDVPQKEAVVQRDFTNVHIDKLVGLDLLILSGNKFISLVESS